MGLSQLPVTKPLDIHICSQLLFYSFCCWGGVSTPTQNYLLHLCWGCLTVNLWRFNHREYISSFPPLQPLHLSLMYHFKWPTEVQLTHNKLYIFKVYNLPSFDICIYMQRHYNSQDSKHITQQKRFLHAPSNPFLQPFSAHVSQATTDPPPVTID